MPVVFVCSFIYSPSYFHVKRYIRVVALDSLKLTVRAAVLGHGFDA